jgi:hypothetical protein
VRIARRPYADHVKSGLFTNGYQQLALAQAAAESVNSVITSTVVPALTISAKPKTIRAKSLFMVVIPFVAGFHHAEGRGREDVTKITRLPKKIKIPEHGGDALRTQRPRRQILPRSEVDRGGS